MTTLKYTTTFEVEGAFAFPIDMLRYDQCHPVTSEDAAQIEASFECRSGKRHVKLKFNHEVARSTAGPTIDRWKSFGWRVIPESLTTTRI